MERMNIEQEMKALDPKKVRLEVDAYQDLRLTVGDDEGYKKVRALRTFPISAPDHFIAFRDEEGEEIGVVEDPQKLDPRSRAVLMEELEKTYLMPRIVRINGIDESFGVPKWDVETDHGPRVFELKSRRDARMIGRGRVMIQDIDGNRYEIPDYRTLDPQSRDLVEMEV